jgi:hypothetical protein
MFKKFVNSLIFLSLLLPINTSSAKAEECPTYDFSSIFFEDYYPNKKWTAVGQTKTITWSLNASVVSDEVVTRKFSLNEIEWVKSSIQSWDNILSSVSFQQTEGEVADLLIGWVPLTSGTSTSSYETYAYWNAWWLGDIRNRATIRMKQTANFIQTKEGFIHVLQHELGNVLGVGDIKPSDGIQSVLEDPVQKPYGQIPLGNYDTGLIRQMYGESTCPSSWSNNPVTSTPTPQDESAKLKTMIMNLTKEIELIKAQNVTLSKKLSKICKQKPKPKGC